MIIFDEKHVETVMQIIQFSKAMFRWKCEHDDRSNQKVIMLI